MAESGEMIEDGVFVDIKLTDDEIIQWEFMQQRSIECLLRKKKSLRARFMYGIIFSLVNLVAWFLRDYGQRVSLHFHVLKACGPEGHECFQTMGVLRVSLGCFIFFFIMFLTTCGTSKLYNIRNTWHSGWWSLKLAILLIALVFSFFIPSDYVHLYGEFARVGAGIFLILQLISVIEFIAWWNAYWMPDERKKRSSCCGLFMSTLFYLASLCGIIAMYAMYASKPSCTLNIFFITWTAILLLVMMAISLHSKVNRGLLSSGIMASYVVFLCWSALRSEPAHEKCSPQHDNKHVDWMTVLGFLIGVSAIVMATFSTGIDSETFQLKKQVDQMEDDIPYNYGFFHLIFSLGAMYFAMLFISWNLDSSTRKWSIDVGWASTWVKIVNEWFAATIYLWKLIWPIVRQPKIMNHEEPMQQDQQ
ncbi:serinc-domain containing serine and sphingolipid biosynthesis protein [Artemisia annua]|uniref:Serinc-domain containing serine and sphingolipid biosynthesis protein n=1 Tax=Artemisia annua TaxID=35608 RepID=A0A2U1P747_ARTAN|nr:serinc-domain containing serine and sphingolipid biosynthesis protein [Artemisia annua]